MPEISGIIQNYLEGSISTIGRAPVIESKSITENGTYTAPEGVDGYSPITVNVPAPVIESKSITENGTYTAPEGVDGYSPITVNVPVPTPVIESKSITANGTYTAPEGVDGYSPITVNVPAPDLSTLIVRTNGIYTAQQHDVDGFNIVDVYVPSGATIIVNNDYLIENYVLQTVLCDFTEDKYYGFVIYDDYTYPRYNYQLGCGMFKRFTGTQNYYWANHMGSISNAIITDSTFTLASVFDSDSSTAKITIFEIGNNIISSVIPQ